MHVAEERWRGGRASSKFIFFWVLTVLKLWGVEGWGRLQTLKPSEAFLTDKFWMWQNFIWKCAKCTLIPSWCAYVLMERQININYSAEDVLCTSAYLQWAIALWYISRFREAWSFLCFKARFWRTCVFDRPAVVQVGREQGAGLTCAWLSVSVRCI